MMDLYSTACKEALTAKQKVNTQLYIILNLDDGILIMCSILTKILKVYIYNLGN